MSRSRIFTIIPSAAYTADIAYDLNGLPGDWNEIVAYLDVTAKSGTSPTLDIDYETTVDGGTTFFSHTSFTQATDVTTEKKTLSAPIGIDGRINVVIGGTDTPTFTYTLRLECKSN